IRSVRQAPRWRITSATSPKPTSHDSTDVGLQRSDGFAKTTIVPVSNACASQTKVKVPGVSKRHVPIHPWTSGEPGSGGTAPELRPLVCVQDVGCAASKSTLCE